MFNPEHFRDGEALDDFPSEENLRTIDIEALNGFLERINADLEGLSPDDARYDALMAQKNQLSGALLRRKLAR